MGIPGESRVLGYVKTDTCTLVREVKTTYQKASTCRGTLRLSHPVNQPFAASRIFVERLVPLVSSKNSDHLVVFVNCWSVQPYAVASQLPVRQVSMDTR